MASCEKCGIDVSEPRKNCPLCGGNLKNAGEGEYVFPNVQPKSQFRLLYALAALVLIAASLICVAINVSGAGSGFWSAFVVAGALSAGVALVMFERKKGNIFSSIAWQTAVISAMSFAWDYFTGFHRWSLEYVIPIIYICAVVAAGLISLIVKPCVQDCMLYITVNCFFGIAPLMFIIFDTVRTKLPSALCFTFSMIELSVLVIFYGGAMRDELIRRFHI